MKLLHLIATPRGAASNSLRISQAYLEALGAAEPDLDVTTVDLFTTRLPDLVGGTVDTKYRLMGDESADVDETWAEIVAVVDTFREADVHLLTVPMWNFSVPYVLKHYIDTVVQPGLTFTRNEHGVPVGMLEGRRMVCVSTRGADYSAGSPVQALDQVESYLRSIYAFMGITEAAFVTAQPMDYGPEVREAAVARAVEEVRVLAGGPTTIVVDAEPAAV